MNTGGETGLSREVKQQIKRWVLELRHLLEDDFERQLRRYGIEAGEDIAPVDELDYLTDDEKRKREVIEATIRREAENEGGLAGGVKAYVRDAAYTYLNRLVGLKCMEARGILFVDGEATEVITTRPEYGGRSRLLWQMRDEDPSYREADSEERLWHDGLILAFEAVTEDIKLLFDPEHEFSQLFPSHRALMEAVGLINDTFPLETYAYPDFLGWVYQFFNVEEKERIRKETKGKPRTGYELAVINQFYTPDWIVKFLVDNTLGRVWLQMHPDTRLYWLNRIPEEHRDGPREEVPAEVRDAEMFQGVNIDYLVPDTGEDEPIDAKPVGEMKLLDPACGTMHFGQYAYTIFYEMYLEELDHAGEEGWPEQASVSGPAEIPNAILERNLHGVDIDERAIQIAALTLMLTMKEQTKAHGLDPKEVRVRDMNLVCADAVNLGPEEMEDFLERLEPQKFGGEQPMRRAVEAVWSSLEHVAELGSLIQPGEEVERALSEPVQWELKFYSPEQAKLGEGPEWGEMQQELSARDRVSARDYLIDKLQEFAAANGDDDIMQRLFAKETEKGLALLTVLGQKHDAVVTNPPYGEFTQGTKAWAQTAYGAAGKDIYTAFIDAALSRLTGEGYSGQLTPKTFMFQSKFKAYRRGHVIPGYDIPCLMEFDLGILDGATVRTAAFICRDGGYAGGRRTTTFFRLMDADVAPNAFIESVRELTSGSSRECVFLHSLDSFQDIPNGALSYWAPEALLGLFASAPGWETMGATVTEGLTTEDDERFIHLFWECPLGAEHWVSVSKLSERDTYYADWQNRIDWSASSRAVLATVGNQIANQAYYGRPGYAIPCIGEIRMEASLLGGCEVFAGVTRHMVYDRLGPDKYGRLAYLNSRLNWALHRALTPDRHRITGNLRLLPYPREGVVTGIRPFAKGIYFMKRCWDGGNEICTRFEKPWLLRALEQFREKRGCGGPQEES